MKDHLNVLKFFLPFFLSGCMGIYEGGFECPAGEGTKCKSISDINLLIDKGELPLSESSSTFPCTTNEHGKSCKTLDIWWSPWTEESSAPSSPKKQNSKKGMHGSI